MGGKLIVLSQYWFVNKVDIFMDDFCLERKSALMKWVLESKLGNVITTEENLNVSQEERDGFSEQNKGKVMKVSGLYITELLFFSCELEVVSWK